MENNINEILGIEDNIDNSSLPEKNISSCLVKNKIVNVTLNGGIIGLLADSPQNKLNRRIQKENRDGWRVVQIIPAASGNLFLMLLRLIILLITVFLYTPANGFYIVMIKNVSKLESDSKSPDYDPSNSNDDRESHN